jgi:hypothetical protein
VRVRFLRRRSKNIRRRPVFSENSYKIQRVVLQRTDVRDGILEPSPQPRTLTDELKPQGTPGIGHTHQPSSAAVPAPPRMGGGCIFSSLRDGPRPALRKILQNPRINPIATFRWLWQSILVATIMDPQGRPEASRNPKDRTHPPTKLGGNARTSKDRGAGFSFGMAGAIPSA